MNRSELPTASHEPVPEPARTQTARPRRGGAHRHPAAASALVLGRYRLHRKLGSGAFATVWAAHDERLERDVAVKILERERVAFERFEREARAGARLAHPAIVMLYEAALDEHGAYLVSELVRGRTLRALLDAGRLSDRDIIRILLALCAGLDYAHAQGVIHRDVKPTNILVPARATSEAGAAKLTDFGVACVVGGDTLTRTGDIVGTAAYMAPEQAAGREASAAADLYSLALVAYEALTGVNPVGSAGARTRRLGTCLPPLRRQRRELPRELAIAIDQALRPRPRERGTIEDLRRALVTSLEEVGDAPGVIAPSGWRARRGDDDDDHEPGRAWVEAERRAAVPKAGSTTDERPAGPSGRGWRRLLWERTPVATAPPATRLLGAGAAALTAWWLASHALASAPLPAAALALIAAAATFAAPRLGLTLGTLTLAGIAAAQNRAGLAFLVLLAFLITALLLPRHGHRWPLACGAVALGTVALAGAWPALIGRSGLRAWQRAALAAAGYVWLATAGLLLGRSLYAPVPGSLPPPAAWAHSPILLMREVITPLLHSGVLAGAGVWALAAVLAPLIATGRSLARDALAALVWAAATLAATAGLDAAASSPTAPRGAVVGAVAGGLILVAPALLARGRARAPQSHRAGRPATRIP